jgi:hypothetical protein
LLEGNSIPIRKRQPKRIGPETKEDGIITRCFLGKAAEPAEAFWRLADVTFPIPLSKLGDAVRPPVTPSH